MIRFPMKFPFASAKAAAVQAPLRAEPPQLTNATVAAQYAEERGAGDFFDFIPTASERLLFLLLDIAGRRDQAAAIATYVQERLRAVGPGLFVDPEANESTALTDLALELNRSVIHASGGVRCTPAFLGCYQDKLGLLWYINAGHTPGIVRDANGVSTLDATGLPMGLFSHAIHDAALRVLAPQSVVLLASKGLVEAKAGNEEFGIQRLRELVTMAQAASALDLCKQVLATNDAFMKSGRAWHVAFTHGQRKSDDRTALAIMRTV